MSDDSCGIDVDISEIDVYNALRTLNVTKSSLDDIISNRLLKELADIVAAPICSIINNSLRQGVVPHQWKVSRITPLPKCNPVRNIESDLRPISITCPVSKVAEVFVARLFNEFIDDEGDEHQFGAVPGRSTTLALIKLSYLLFEASDDSKNVIRTLFIDFSRAFDLIDHNVIMRKLDENNCPIWLRNWLLSFLGNRVQFVKSGENVSGKLSVFAGAPQGTRAGPNCFKLLIRDLLFRLPFIKYVDDVTVVSVSHNIDDDSLQLAMCDLELWCVNNGMCLNTKKTKEMCFSFGKSIIVDNCKPLTAGAAVIERVKEFKILGVIFSCDLTWNKHVQYIVAKASKRLFAICHLVRCGFAKDDIVAVYCALIRPVLEYASPVWHCGLTGSLIDDVEHVQMRCLHIIYPELSYSDALFVAGLSRLNDRREAAMVKLFCEMKNPTHVLNGLLPVRPPNLGVVTRDSYPYELIRGRTARRSRSMIAYCVGKRL